MKRLPTPTVAEAPVVVYEALADSWAGHVCDERCFGRELDWDEDVGKEVIE